MPLYTLYIHNVAGKKKSDFDVNAPVPAAKDSWVEVLDKASGQVYYWNQSTNETTALGAAKPVGR